MIWRLYSILLSAGVYSLVGATSYTTLHTVATNYKSSDLVSAVRGTSPLLHALRDQQARADQRVVQVASKAGEIVLHRK
jgi:hypothetical protein